MKDTGVVRKIDELGRFTLPMELRKKMNIDVGDPLEVFVDSENIVLKKFVPCDIFNGATEDLIEYEGKKVSRQTIVALAELAGLQLAE